MHGGAKGNIRCILDTDIAIDYLRGRVYAKRLLQDWAGDGLLAVSSITHLEIYQGMKPGEEDATNAFLDGMVTISLDAATARRAGTLLGGLRARGITIGFADAAIAATALSLGVPLLSNNLEHYPFPGLELKSGLSSER